MPTAFFQLQQQHAQEIKPLVWCTDKSMQQQEQQIQCTVWSCGRLMLSAAVKPKWRSRKMDSSMANL